LEVVWIVEIDPTERRDEALDFDRPAVVRDETLPKPVARPSLDEDLGRRRPSVAGEAACRDPAAEPCERCYPSQKNAPSTPMLGMLTGPTS
jgi:hypothetical protein